MEFRLLRADEIEVRISSVGAWGVQLLLYKDARCDMNILDETVGPENWMRHHSRDNANCIVSIWDEKKSQWIEKEDVGTESFTEREKGLASDSFKRACFNWGVGREIYTAPQIFVRSNELKTLEQNNGKWTCKDYFTVTAIDYEGRKISHVQILNTKTGALLDFGKVTEKKPQEPEHTRDFMEKNGRKKISSREITILQEACYNRPDGLTLEKALKACRKEKVEDINYTQYLALCSQLGCAA